VPVKPDFSQSIVRWCMPWRIITFNQNTNRNGRFNQNTVGLFGHHLFCGFIGVWQTAEFIVTLEIE
jgi:hypothetical protein